MVTVDNIKKLEQSPNKTPYSFVYRLTINPAYSTVSTTLQGLASDFLCTAMNVSIYSNTKCVLDTDPQREPILLQLMANSNNFSVFQNGIDTLNLNAISNNNNFPSFIIPKQTSWTLTVNQIQVMTTPILVAPLTVQVTFIGFNFNELL